MRNPPWDRCYAVASGGSTRISIRELQPNRKEARTATSGLPDGRTSISLRATRCGASQRELRLTSRDRAAERFGLGRANRPAREKSLDRGLQVGGGDLRSDAPVVTQDSTGIQEEDLRRSPSVEKIRDSSFRILDDVEAVTVFEGMGSRLFRR